MLSFLNHSTQHLQLIVGAHHPSVVVVFGDILTRFVLQKYFSYSNVFILLTWFHWIFYCCSTSMLIPFCIDFSYFVILIKFVAFPTYLTTFNAADAMIWLLLYVFKNMKSDCFFWRWICDLLFRYYHISSVYTTSQNTIPIRKNIRRWINISIVYRLCWVTCYFIFVKNHLGILCNSQFFSIVWVFLNVVFWKQITTLMYILISVHLMHTV